MALVLFAFARVALTALVLPPYGNVDETFHWDSVQAYARLELPRDARQVWHPSSIREHALFASEEYGRKGQGLHPMLAPENLRELHVRARTQELGSAVNFMAWEPPFAYGVAAAWLRLGEACGVSSIDRLYWTRCLGAFGLAFLVLLAWRFVRDFAPGREGLALGFPLLLAVWPMDAFYTVNNDWIVAPLAFLGFDLCMRLRRKGSASPWWVWLGLAALWSTVPLSKPTSAPMLVVPFLLLAPIWRGSLARAASFAAVVIGPTLAFMAWSRATTGVWAYWKHKMSFNGFEPRPITAMLEHPGWSWDGFMSFFEGLFTTLYRGELAWHGEAMRIGGIDALCLVVTPVATLLSLAAFGRLAALRGVVRRVAVIALAASVAFLLFSSLSLDFPDRPASQPPSLADPFFRVGRLILGAAPLLLLLVSDGLLRAGGKLLLLVFAAALLVSEIVVMWPVFSSAFHAFSMPR